MAVDARVRKRSARPSSGMLFGRGELPVRPFEEDLHPLRSLLGGKRLARQRQGCTRASPAILVGLDASPPVVEVPVQKAVERLQRDRKTAFPRVTQARTVLPEASIQSIASSCHPSSREISATSSSTPHRRNRASAATRFPCSPADPPPGGAPRLRAPPSPAGARPGGDGRAAAESPPNGDPHRGRAGRHVQLSRGFQPPPGHLVASRQTQIGPPARS